MKLKFKTIVRSLLAMVLLIGGSAQTVKASHYAAVDLSAKYIDQGDTTKFKYQVTLTLYFACRDAAATQTPINADVSATINWVSSTGGSGSRPINTALVADTLDQLCPSLSSQNACYSPGSIYPGFARRIFTDTITLPSAQNDWKFWWSSGSRSNDITNLLNPSGQNIYVEAGINNTGKYWGNSTPEYLAAPVPYFCINQSNNLITDPYDRDFDSLISFNVNPKSAANTNIPYAGGPFSVTNPFGNLPNYTFFSGTGSARFTPTNTGRYVLAFRTEAYDPQTGVRTGYIGRDVQVAVLNCAAPAPAIDSVPVAYTGPGGIIQPGNIISICPNVTTNFDIRASSLSTTNYIQFSSNNIAAAPGSNFTVDTASGTSTGHFSWTPTTADIGTRVVRFTATDTTCNPTQPIRFTSSINVTIRVLPGLDAGIDRKICPLGDNPVQLSVSGPSNKVYRWYSGTGGTPLYIDNRDSPNPIVTPPVDYTYIVRSTDPDFKCKSSDTVVVRVDRSNDLQVIQDPLVVCRPSYITIGVDSIGSGPIQNLPCGVFNTINCPNPDVITVGNPGTSAYVRKNTPFYANRRYAKYQFIIPKSELKDAGMYSGTLKSIAFLSNNPTVLAAQPLGQITVSLKCTDRTSYPIGANNASFEVGAAVVATEPAYSLTPNVWNKINFTSPYNWDTTKNLLVDICMGPYTVLDSNGYDPVDMAPGFALQRYSDVVDVCGGNAPDSNIVRYTQRPVVRFEHCIAPTMPFQYQWKPGTNLADSNKKYTTAYVPYSMNYAVFSKGKNGCLLRDSLHITVPVYTLKVNPKDTAICVFQPAPLHATGAAGYIWYENGFNKPNTLSCDDCADPVATPTVPGDITYTVVFLNPDNCYDTLSQTIHVYALPNIAIGTRDTTIKYGKSVMLTVNGGNQYSWTPVGSLNDPNIPNPIASPSQSTTYVVYGIDQHQCRNSDSVRVNVDFRDNLLVPTGFTPNGDGRNDYFKVVNVTFQKLMEFRVFNRWGQEVFSTNDPMKGWDGKWKGVDQDMGTYKYIIRVAFPDGYVETYKGDVTLIR